MNELICPNCKKEFKVDEAGFADILKQVRDHQFEEEIQSRLALAEKDKESAIKLAEANFKNSSNSSKCRCFILMHSASFDIVQSKHRELLEG